MVCHSWHCKYPQMFNFPDIIQLKSLAITLAGCPACSLSMACSLCCGFKRGLASVSKLTLTIIEIFKPFIPIMKYENHEHLTIQNFNRKVCPTKGGRFECSTTSDKNHPSGKFPLDVADGLPCVLINGYFGIKKNFCKCNVSFAVQCIIPV